MRQLETTRQRSALMKRVRRHGTQPEKAVSRILWALGARYRLNVEDLPGSPDIANKSRGKAIFVHGCFWHFHEDCPRGTVPQRNREFWQEKFKRNKERDARKEASLSKQGFDVAVVWECELRDPEKLRDRLASFWFAEEC